MTKTSRRIASVAVLATLGLGLAALPLLAQPQSSDQTRCIAKINKAGSKVAKMQGKEIGRCLKDAAAGKLESGQTAQQCLTADNRGKVAKTEAKTVDTEADRCTLVVPSFGFTDAATVNAAAKDEEVALAADLFGPDLDAAVIDRSDRAGFKCQRQVQKRYEKIAVAKIKEFARCKKRALKRGTVTSANDLAGCLVAAVAQSPRVGKAIVKLTDTIDRKCSGVDLDAAFPGACSGAPDFPSCIDPLVECRVCRMLSLMDGMPIDCDEFDDGTVNGSCDSPFGPTTTTVPTTTTTILVTTTSTTTTTTTSTTTTTVPLDVCGNGILETGEDCDDGNTAAGDCCSPTCAFESGGSPCDDGNVCTDGACDGGGICLTVANNSDPCDDGVFCNGTDTCSGGTCSQHSGDPCSGGAECNDTCNEGAGNCLSASGTACTDDGDVCTDDVCDGAGLCSHPFNSAPCDDGQFCTATDVCTGGACVGSGDPCSGGAECNDTCNETADDCLTPAATACTDDGNGCTDDACDGAGLCAHTANSDPCDDGLFCNGTDTCSGGSCSVHTGDPCPGADGDLDCTESCNETFDDCSASDGDGATCDDFVFCNGADTCASGSCTVHAGSPCDGPDGDGDCTETCNETLDDCSAADPVASPCDDGLFCNGPDTCQGGTCSVHGGDPCDGPDGDGDCSETCDEGGDTCNGNDPVGLGCDDGSCPPCPNGQSCLDGSDCQSGVCSGGTCQVPTCSDSVENGNETDVDCGGGVCPLCVPGDGCNGGSDCTSGVCSGGICQSPTCSDGVQNGSETDVDCGGSCPGCGTGDDCNSGSDCASGVCGGGTCNAPTCSDGVKNGSESDVDCGGSCTDCTLGKSCNSGSDCTTNFCQGGFCRCPSNLYTFNVSSNSGGVFDSAEWPGGTQFASGPSGCNVTMENPSGNIDLVGNLGDKFRVQGFSGYSNCFGTGGEDGDGCQPNSCPPAGIGFCEATRPSCSAALNGSGSARYFVQCNP